MIPDSSIGMVVDFKPLITLNIRSSNEIMVKKKIKKKSPSHHDAHNLNSLDALKKAMVWSLLPSIYCSLCSLPNFQELNSWMVFRPDRSTKVD